MTSFKRFKCLNSFELRLLAMLFMFCDHLWATAVSGNMWLTNVGRLAFPIFAFEIAEGFVKTGNFKKYIGRVFLFALISEIPFNMMYAGSIIFPFHQNVLFTFTISLLLLRFIKWGRDKGKVLFALCAAAAVLMGNILGQILMADYYNYGILTVILFYLCRDFKLAWVFQLVGMYIINVVMMGGMVLNYNLFGINISFCQQALSLLALIPIWMYNGERGPDSGKIRLLSYFFYPLHMAILAIITLYLLN